MIELIDSWKVGERNPDCPVQEKICVWINYPNDFDQSTVYHFHNKQDAWDFEGDFDKRFKYCPYCGSKIEVENG